MKENQVKINWFDMSAVKILSTKLNDNTISLINNYIDNHKLEDMSHNLVGQINQNKKSAQLKLSLTDEDPKFLSEILINISRHYAEIHNLKIDKFVMESIWSVHSYSGDFNPIHDHTLNDVRDSGLSCILYLKVPECIEAAGEIDESFSLAEASGDCDGFTQFVWGMSAPRDLFKPPTSLWIKPEEGLLLMFPIWLQHLVEPFYGEGERRSISANISVHTEQMKSLAKSDSSDVSLAYEKV